MTSFWPSIPVIAPAVGKAGRTRGDIALLGDPTRLRLMQVLAVTEMCVCDLAALLDSTLSAVSHQLRLLRTSGLVRYRKEGKMVYYRLTDARLVSVLLEGQRFITERELKVPCMVVIKRLLQI